MKRYVINSLTKLLFWALLIYFSSIPKLTDANNLEGPTILGAISDEPATRVTIEGQDIFIYQAARNKLLRDQDKFEDVTLYYCIAPQIKKNNVKSFPSISDATKNLIQIKIEPTNINIKALLEKVHNNIDPFVKEANLLPIALFGTEVQVMDSLVAHVSGDIAQPFSSPIIISIPVDANQSNIIVNAIRDGSVIKVKYETLVKLSQLNDTRISWREVANTKTYRDYNGPSGPQYITAAQAANASISILSDLNVRHWREVDSGGATDKDFQGYLDKVQEIFLKTRQEKALKIEEWADSRRFEVPVSKFQNLVDQINEISTDSKNLNANDWCKKYKKEIRNLSESSEDSGFSLGIKFINIGFSDQRTNKKYYEDIANSEDCGKKIIENNFSYDFRGNKYIPKTIKVFEKINVNGIFQDNERIIDYKIRQRLGKNEWTISAE